MRCREVHLHRDNRDEQLIYLPRFPCVVCYVQDTRTQVARVSQIFIEKLWVLRCRLLAAVPSRAELRARGASSALSL
jgi:hypothetical protein